MKSLMTKNPETLNTQKMKPEQTVRVSEKTEEEIWDLPLGNSQKI